MALTDDGGNGNNMVMPVAPLYGNGGGYGNGFGDWSSWIILFLIFGMFGGWGGGFGGFGGGFGGFNNTLSYDFPWLLSGQTKTDAIVANGFQNAALNGAIGDLSTAVNAGFGNVQLGIAGVNQNICQTGNGIVSALNSGFANAETGANARQMANMQQLYGLSSQFADCCCKNQLATADLKYTVAQENCADRYEAAQNTRDIMENCNRNNQAILDKLCQLELDGIKGQLAQAQRENVGLQNQLNMATLRESQTAQNAFIQQGFANEVDQLYNRLNSCPVPTTPVYGRTPIFTCNGQNYSGGCGCSFAA